MRAIIGFSLMICLAGPVLSQHQMYTAKEHFETIRADMSAKYGVELRLGQIRTANVGGITIDYDLTEGTSIIQIIDRQPVN